jgi:hypothetical protein
MPKNAWQIASPNDPLRMVARVTALQPHIVTDKFLNAQVEASSTFAVRLRL